MVYWLHCAMLLHLLFSFLFFMLLLVARVVMVCFKCRDIRVLAVASSVHYNVNINVNVHINVNSV